MHVVNKKILILQTQDGKKYNSVFLNILKLVL